MNNKKCRFSVHNNCTLLIETSCDGTDESCSFYKTELQFNRDVNHAILINHKKGNCENCKYREKKCDLSLI